MKFSTKLTILLLIELLDQAVITDPDDWPGANASWKE